MAPYRPRISFWRMLRLGVSVVALLFNLSVGTLAVWFFFWPGSIHIPLFRPHHVMTPPVIEYKDFVAILLSALGVMIALGSGVIAVLAIFGFTEGRRFVEELTKKEVGLNLESIVARLVMDQRKSETAPAEGDRISQAAGVNDVP